MNARTPRIAIDTNRIWEETRQAIRKNADVLLAPIGVLVTLPTLAVLLLRPFPIQRDGETFEALSERILIYWQYNWWMVLLFIASQTLAFQVVIALLADPERPTVGRALAKALRLLTTLFIVELAIAFVAIFAGAIVMLSGAAAGNFALALLTTVLGLMTALFILARFSLIAPVVQLGGLINPAQAFIDAFRLTRGCAWQLLGFLVLLYFATYIVTWLLGALIILLVALSNNGEAIRLAQAITQALSQSVVVLVIASTVAGLYQQVISQR